MKRAWACLLLLSAAGELTADDAALQEARRRWLRGNYAEAREEYETLAKDPKLRDRAAVGLSLIQQSQGELEGALSTLDGALRQFAEHADLHARRAEL